MVFSQNVERKLVYILSTRNFIDLQALLKL
jgi:hypothetical protein